MFLGSMLAKSTGREQRVMAIPREIANLNCLDPRRVLYRFAQIDDCFTSCVELSPRIMPNFHFYQDSDFVAWWNAARLDHGEKVGGGT